MVDEVEMDAKEEENLQLSPTVHKDFVQSWVKTSSHIMRNVQLIKWLQL